MVANSAMALCEVAGPLIEQIVKDNAILLRHFLLKMPVDALIAHNVRQFIIMCRKPQPNSDIALAN